LPLGNAWPELAAAPPFGGTRGPCRSLRDRLCQTRRAEFMRYLRMLRRKLVDCALAVSPSVNGRSKEAGLARADHAGIREGSVRRA